MVNHGERQRMVVQQLVLVIIRNRRNYILRDGVVQVIGDIVHPLFASVE